MTLLDTVQLCDETYSLHYDPKRAHITLTGSLRLQGMQGYQPLNHVLEQSIAAHDSLELDVQALEYLNSSGINMLAKFVIAVRQHDSKRLTIYGSENYPWQPRSLSNLQRLMPRLHVVMSAQDVSPS